MKQTRIIEDICRQVTDRIIRGELKPGDKLPAERELAMTFEVGRSTIRESLRKLEHAGLVSIRTGSAGGAIIANKGAESVIQALTLMLQLERVSPEDLLEARKIIETGTAKLAALRATPEDLANIRLALDRPENFSPKEGFIATNAEFHEAIARAAKSKVLSATLRAVRDLIGMSIRMLPIDDHMMTMSHHFHTVIYEAIAAGDAGLAQKSMEEHLEKFHVIQLAALVSTQGAEGGSKG